MFACQTHGNIVFEVLVPKAFQKYSTCMVYSEKFNWARMPSRGRGGGGHMPIVNFAQIRKPSK